MPLHVVLRPYLSTCRPVNVICNSHGDKRNIARDISVGGPLFFSGETRALRGLAGRGTMKVSILGTRGIPARHGGFETFAEQLATYLVARGHEVVVYCQRDGKSGIHTDRWHGVTRVHISVPNTPIGTMTFDWKSVLHASRNGGMALTLGYNTAIFTAMLHWKRVPHVMNMDGLEWKRQKWSRAQRAWLWVNELAGAAIADHLIADHPEIKAHLMRHTAASKISVIPYGAASVTHEAPLREVHPGLVSGEYYLLIARPEPENSILEIVQAFSRRPRSSPLVILGKYSPAFMPFHRRVLQAAGSDVIFTGPIYDKAIVRNLRYHCKAYVHGHQVGGTNPSLVESLAAGNAVIAHDNPFNRWVAGDGGVYFDSVAALERVFDQLEKRPEVLEQLRSASRQRHHDEFGEQRVMVMYEALLEQWHGREQLHGAAEELYRQRA